MPESNEETSTKSRPTGLLRIVAWWRKFHFSGRVIMCSVLLGLGLILIGALIFVINMDDVSNKPKVDDNSAQLPTKAPANYSGPVVMGIGSFIVIVGVIMCLFETQVCRKKTGDASPLIREKTDDPENKSSDPTSVPSTSHGHKIHRHGARKVSASPRKSKSRYGKSRSRERNPQKSPSPKSRPVPIESPKSFITSSEDNFLTPPNTLDENVTVVKNDNLQEADDKNSSLMKSFTSSGPSWNQSGEFLTPSTSFRDTSVSLNNSIEVERNHDENIEGNELSEKQFINSEYETPLTIEEHRIQQLLIRVKNEQKQMSDSGKQPRTESVENLSSEAKLDSQMIHNEIFKNEMQSDIKSEKAKSPNDELHPVSESLNLKDDKKQETLQDEELQKLEQIKSENNVIGESVKVNIDKPVKDTSHEIISITDAKMIQQHENQEEKNCQSDLTPASLENTNNNISLPSDKETSQIEGEKNDEQIDFDSSVSSNETIVSPDTFQENPIKVNNENNENNTSSLSLKENSRNESEGLKTSESTNNEVTTIDDNLTQTDTLKEDKDGIQDLNIRVNESLETLSNDVKTTKEMENDSKDTSS